jgi:hypothetical protein
VHGVRRDYYSDPVEDALILWLDRGTTSGPGSNGVDGAARL